MANIFRTASMWLKIATICMMLGILVYVIGFATPSWKGGSYGLFNYKTINDKTVQYHDNQLNDFRRAIQAMECIGLIGFFLALLTLLLYLCADTMRRRDFLQAACAFTWIGVLFTCIGYAMFGSENEDVFCRGCKLTWSFILAIAGTVLYGVAGIMLILQLIGR